jgi:hypothetical protein
MMGKLRGAYRYAWYCNQRLFHEAAGVIRDLEAAGVATLVLKGAALSAIYYRDGGTRPMDDLDLLIRLDDVQRAVRVLREAGWTIDSEWPLDAWLITRHAIACSHRTGQELDLHWEALYEPGSDDAFWARSVPIEVRGAATRALCPEDQLIHICIHGIGPWPGPVRWVADAVMVLKAAGERLDWGAVVKEARERRVTAALSEALHYLVATFDTPVPDEALVALTRSKAGPAQRLAHRAAVARPSAGRMLVFEWDRYRRLRQVNPALAPPSFLVYLQHLWGLASWRQVTARLAARLVLSHSLPVSLHVRSRVGG